MNHPRACTRLITMVLCFAPSIAHAHNPAQSTHARAADQSSPPPRPPNVVLLVCDDLGSAEIGPAPTPQVPAPNVRALAAAGATFTRAYATAPMCAPSRAALLTGQYQQRHGFEFNPEHAPGVVVDYNRLGLDPDTRTLAEALRTRGYRTAAIGKWHLGEATPFDPLNHGFDEFFGYRGGSIDHRGPEQGQRPLWRNSRRTSSQGYLTDVFTDEACAFIDRNADRPFLLYVAFSAVHKPVQPRPGDSRFAELPQRERRYARMIAAIDDGVGRITQSLERHHLTDHTIVVFMSDNGGENRGGVHVNGRLRMGKRYLFEGGIRVPLVMRWPGVARPGLVVDDVCSTLDLLPTFVHAAGGNTLWSRLDGADLAPALRGTVDAAAAANTPDQQPPASADAAQQAPAPLAGRALFWRFGDATAVRIGPWKLVRSGDSRWLFDLATDEQETTNLAASQPDVVQELERRLAAWNQRLEKPRWPAPRHVVTPIDGQEYQVCN